MIIMTVECSLMAGRATELDFARGKSSSCSIGLFLWTFKVFMAGSDVGFLGI